MVLIRCANKNKIVCPMLTELQSHSIEWPKGDSEKGSNPLTVAPLIIRLATLAEYSERCFFATKRFGDKNDFITVLFFLSASLPGFSPHVSPAFFAAPCNGPSAVSRTVIVRLKRGLSLPWARRQTGPPRDHVLSPVRVQGWFEQVANFTTVASTTNQDQGTKTTNDK